MVAKKLLWFKWVRGQSYSVYLIIYLPSYTQHLLSLEWFKHIITSCFSSFIMLVCYYNSGRNLSWPLQSISLYWTPMCLPQVFFFKFPIYYVENSKNCIECFGMGRLGSHSIKSLPPMPARDKWMWRQVLSKLCWAWSMLSLGMQTAQGFSGIFTKTSLISAWAAADSWLFSSLLLCYGWCTHTNTRSDAWEIWAQFLGQWISWSEYAIWILH